MRVLIVHNRYRSGSPGGEDVVVDQETRLLRDAGVEVRQYSRSNDEMSEKSWIDRLRVATQFADSRRTSRELVALFRAFDPDVVHVHNTFPLVTSAVYSACARANVPVVQTIHNYRWVCAAATHYRQGAVCEACTPGRPLAAVRHRCYRNSFLGSLAVASMISSDARRNVHSRFIDRFFVLGRFAAERLASQGVDPRKIVVKPNFVPPSTAVREDSRRMALFVGRLAPEKGLNTLLRACALVRGVSLGIVGDGPMREELEREVIRRGLDVHFLGMQDRSGVRALLSQAMFLVTPSEWFEAGIPLVVLEAWAEGTPVIAPRFAGMADLNDGEDALTFSVGCVEGLADCIRRMASSGSLRAKIAAGGRTRQLAEHTPRASLSTLLDTYSQVCRTNSV